jgi:hypothetical protein
MIRILLLFCVIGLVGCGEKVKTSGAISENFIELYDVQITTQGASKYNQFIYVKSDGKLRLIGVIIDEDRKKWEVR